MAVTIKNPVTIVKQGGGGGGEIKEKDINFYDYDGTLLYSYTVAEAQALTELPALPDHSSLLTVNGTGEIAATLVGDGWTHTLQEIKSTRLAYVGACYKINTSAAQNPDKCCAMIVNIPIAHQTLTLRFSNFSTNDVVHWGDNSQSAITQSPMSHTYQTAGRYLVFIFAEGATGLKLGQIPNSGEKFSFFGTSLGSTATYMDTSSPLPQTIAVELLVIGGVYLDAGAFALGRNLDSVIVTRYCRGADKAVFYWCGTHKFECLIFPPELPVTADTTRFGATYNLVAQDSCLEIGIAPRSTAAPITLICGQALSRLEPPKYLNNGIMLISTSGHLSKIKIGSNLFADNDTSLYYNWIQASSVSTTTPQMQAPMILVFDDRTNFPINICKPSRNAGNSSTAYVYYGLPNLRVLDFRAQTTVLTLAATSDFTDRIQPNVKVVVPDNLYASWVADAQWSGVASQIVKDSDYNE